MEAPPETNAGTALWTPGQTLDEVGEDLWNGVLASWQDVAAHDRFLRHCVAAGRLAAAGARYRAYREVHPSDAQALLMQQKIVGLATQFLVPAARDRQRQGADVAGLLRSRWFILIVVAGACGGALLGFVWGGLP